MRVPQSMPNLDGVEIGQELLTEEEMRKMQGEDGGDVVNDVDLSKVAVDKLPDPDQLADRIIELLERLEDPELQFLKKTQYGMYEHVLDQQFGDFADQHPGLYQMVLELNDPTMVFEYLNNLAAVKNGEMTFEEATHKFTDLIDQMFLYQHLTSDQIAEIEQKKKKDRASAGK